MRRSIRHKFNQAIESIRPQRYLDYRPYLEAVYQTIKKTQTTYSYQEFAQDLGFSRSTILHQFIKGHRKLSHKSATRIAKALRLDRDDSKFFLALTTHMAAPTPAAKDKAFSELLRLQESTLASSLDRDTLDYFSGWQHAVIRELITLGKHHATLEWLHKHITPQLPKRKIRESLLLLERLNLIEQQDAFYTATCNTVTTGEKVRGMGLLNYHKQMIDLGKLALTTLPAKDRNIGAVTISCTATQAQMIKARINMLMQDVLGQSNPEEGTTVYQLNTQLFPLSKSTEDDPS